MFQTRHVRKKLVLPEYFLDRIERMRALAAVIGLVLVAALPTTQAFEEKPNLAGVYTGSLMSGGQRWPAVTRFEIDPKGELRGSYSYIENGKKSEGRLGGCVRAEPHTFLCKWQDPAGTGLLRVQFAPDGQSFLGLWGTGEKETPFMPWDGVKEGGVQVEHWRGPKPSQPFSEPRKNSGACEAILVYANGGRLGDLMIQNAASERVPVYAARGDFDGDGKEELFSDSGSYGSEVQLENENGKQVLSFRYGKRNEVDAITRFGDMDHWERRVVQWNGRAYIIVVDVPTASASSTREFRQHVSDSINKVRAVVELAFAPEPYSRVICEMAPVHDLGEPVARKLLSPAERIMRQARERNVDPWHIAVGQIGRAGYDALVASGVSLDSPVLPDWPSPIWVCIQNKRPDLVADLLKRGASPNGPANSSGTGPYPIDHAISENDLELARMLIGNDISRLKSSNGGHLVAAAIYNDRDKKAGAMLDLLFDAGAPLDYEAETAWLATEAVQVTRPSVKESLLRHGLQPDKVFNSRIPAIDLVACDTSYYADDLRYIAKTGWLAIGRVGTKWEIAPAVLAMTPSEELIGLTCGVKNAVFAIRGLPLKPGPITKAELESGGYSAVDGTITIHFNAKRYTLTANQDGQAFTLSRDNGAWHVLLNRHPGESNYVHWAGDLDRDGELDIYLGSEWQGGGADSLLLSGGVKNGGTVNAAVTREVGE